MPASRQGPSVLSSVEGRASVIILVWLPRPANRKQKPLNRVGGEGSCSRSTRFIAERWFDGITTNDIHRF